MERVQTASLRLMLGTFRTTPAIPMQHMAAIIPMKHYLRQICDGAASRLHTLPTYAQPILHLSEAWTLQKIQLPVGDRRWLGMKGKKGLKKKPANACQTGRVQRGAG